MDRAGELRSQPEVIESLWKSARIIEVGKGRVRSTTEGLTYLPSTECEVGERYFLGIDRSDDQPYFAWASGAVEDDVEDYLTLRE